MRHMDIITRRMMIYVGYWRGNCASDSSEEASLCYFEWIGTESPPLC